MTKRRLCLAIFVYLVILATGIGSLITIVNITK